MQRKHPRHTLDDKMHAYLFDTSETATFARLDCTLDLVEFSETINAKC